MEEPNRLSRDDVTSILDLVALLAVAVGVGWGLWSRFGGFAIAFAGAIVLAGSAFATWRSAPRPSTADKLRRREILAGRWAHYQAERKSRRLAAQRAAVELAGATR